MKPSHTFAFFALALALTSCTTTETSRSQVGTGLSPILATVFGSQEARPEKEPKSKRTTEKVGAEKKNKRQGLFGGAFRNPEKPVATEKGIASFYTDHILATGDNYDGSLMAAAHKTLPFGTRVRVLNHNNDREVTVFINDRGPYIEGRIIDLTVAAAREIGMIESGIVPVTIEIFPPEED